MGREPEEIARVVENIDGLIASDPYRVGAFSDLLWAFQKNFVLSCRLF